MKPKNERKWERAGHRGCQPIIKVIVKMQKHKLGRGWGRGGDGCEPRIEVIVRMQKKCKKVEGGSGGWISTKN